MIPAPTIAMSAEFSIVVSRDSPIPFRTQGVPKRRNTGNKAHDTQPNERPAPSEGCRKPGHAVARQYTAKITNAVDDSRCGAATLPAAEIHGDGSCEKRVRSNQEKRDQRNQDDRPGFQICEVPQGEPH